MSDQNDEEGSGPFGAEAAAAVTPMEMEEEIAVAITPHAAAPVAQTQSAELTALLEQIQMEKAQMELQALRKNAEKERAIAEKERAIAEIERAKANLELEDIELERLEKANRMEAATLQRMELEEKRQAARLRADRLERIEQGDDPYYAFPERGYAPSASPLRAEIESRRREMGSATIRKTLQPSGTPAFGRLPSAASVQSSVDSTSHKRRSMLKILESDLKSVELDPQERVRQDALSMLEPSKSVLDARGRVYKSANYGFERLGGWKLGEVGKSDLTHHQQFRSTLRTLASELGLKQYLHTFESAESTDSKPIPLYGTVETLAHAQDVMAALCAMAAEEKKVNDVEECMETACSIFSTLLSTMLCKINRQEHPTVYKTTFDKRPEGAVTQLDILTDLLQAIESQQKLVENERVASALLDVILILSKKAPLPKQNAAGQWAEDMKSKVQLYGNMEVMKMDLHFGLLRLNMTEALIDKPGQNVYLGSEAISMLKELRSKGKENIDLEVFEAFCDSVRDYDRKLSWKPQPPPIHAGGSVQQKPNQQQQQPQQQQQQQQQQPANDGRPLRTFKCLACTGGHRVDACPLIKARKPFPDAQLKAGDVYRAEFLANLRTDNAKYSELKKLADTTETTVRELNPGKANGAGKKNSVNVSGASFGTRYDVLRTLMDDDWCSDDDDDQPEEICAGYAVNYAAVENSTVLGRLAGAVAASAAIFTGAVTRACSLKATPKRYAVHPDTLLEQTPRDQRKFRAKFKQQDLATYAAMQLLPTMQTVFFPARLYKSVGLSARGQRAARRGDVAPADADASAAEELG